MILLTRLTGSSRKHHRILAAELAIVERTIKVEFQEITVTLNGVEKGTTYTLVMDGEQFERIKRAVNTEIV